MDMLNNALCFKQLESAGIGRCDTLLIHTSLRAIGDIDGGGDGLINMFQAYLKDGLFIVPTHTWATVSAAQPVFNVRSEVPCIGTLPKLAAFRQDGFRSLNPTHSMVAFGNDAENYIKNEEKVRTPMPGDGCWGRLATVGAKILLIGVGLERNTFMHAVDEIAETPNRLSADSVSFTDIDRYGNRISHPMKIVLSEGIADVSANFPKFERYLWEHGAISYAKIGNADTIVCDACKTLDALLPVYQEAKSKGVELYRDMTPLNALLRF